MVFELAVAFAIQKGNASMFIRADQRRRKNKKIFYTPGAKPAATTTRADACFTADMCTCCR